MLKSVCRVWAIIITLSGLTSNMTLCQTDSTPTPNSENPMGFSQRGVSVEEYLIHPGDVLSIKILGLDNLSTTQTVGPDGQITLALLSPVKAAGITSADLQKKLAGEYKLYLKNPVVGVSVTRFHQSTAQVIGQVKTPGIVPVEEGFILSDYIAYSGGFISTSDMAHVTITRLNGDKLTVDAGSKSDPKSFPEIKEGDIILVPEVRGNVSAIGRVQKPGTFEFKRGMRVSDAVTLAGGALPDGDLTQTVVFSADSETKVNLGAFLEKADDTQNPELFPGDRVYIPESSAKVYVFGAVVKAGAYVAKPGERMMDTILRAGGLSDKSVPSKSGIVRHENGAAQQIRVNLTDYMHNGDLAQNPEIRPGDLVFVNEKSNKSPFSDFNQLLIPFNTLFSLILR